MSSVKSQEASSSASPSSYDVFLSFKGEDTFIDHLYIALDQARFCTFRDDDHSTEKGEDIESKLEKAIQESRISIIVFSKNYASSTWCLEELVMILKRRSTSGHAVLPIFYDVSPSEVRMQIGNFKEAFTRHEEKLESETGKLAKEKLKEKIGTWRAALREVADLAGMHLQNQVDGHEARFIKQIVKVVGDKLHHTTLNNAPHLVGIHPRVKDIQLWLEDGPSNVGMVAICGMGGIGKTTTAKFLYNLNFSRFEGSSFIPNVREISQLKDGLLHLQRQFLTDICKTRNVKLNNIAEGTAMIKDAIGGKKVFVVLDDVDKRDQLDALLGMQGWLSPGSKIIITTRHEQLLGAYEFFKVHRLENLSDEESLELFSWHAFGKGVPDNGYGNVSKMVVSYCGGLPLAISILGSHLSGQSLNVWRTHLDKLEAIPDNQILEKLRISYDSLQDHDKHLFLNLACFFVGSNKDSTVTILDGCEFYTMVGIQNLVDRCLISIDESNTLVMHHLLQEMGREIVRQESPRQPGTRSILWDHMDALDVLRQRTGTSEIEGLKLDMDLLKEELSIWGGWLKRFGFSSNLEPTDLDYSNQVACKADAFARMCKLKLLQLNRIHISGPYKKFPKGLRWLCWRGFQLKSIPRDFPLESLVALDMQYSCLKNIWDGTKFLPLLKILNLSHSYNLAKTPDFSELPNLERLVLKSCTSLIEIHESIGHLERLVLLDLEKCKSLRNLPSSICMLKHLETLVISGCSNLNMESLTALLASGIVVNQSLPTNGQVIAVQSFIWPRLLKLVGISPFLSRAKLLDVWPGLNFWYYLAIISSPAWVFSFLAMDFIKKTTDLVFIFLISTLTLSCFAINFILSQFYFSLPSIPETDRFFRGYQRAGKTIGYTLLFFSNVGLYYFTEKSVACMLTFLFLAFYCLCALFCIQPYPDFGALEFLLSACMNQTLSLFGLRSSYSCLVIIACIVIAGIRFRLEPAEVTTNEVDPAEATTDEVDLESGRRNT